MEEQRGNAMISAHAACPPYAAAIVPGILSLKGDHHATLPHRYRAGGGDLCWHCWRTRGGIRPLGACGYSVHREAL